MERGERLPKPSYVIATDEALMAQGLLVEAAKLLWQDGVPEWTQEYVELEAEAIALHTFDAHVINGLLQTEVYAHAVISTQAPAVDDEETERAVHRRLSRQKLLHRKPPPRLTFLVQECTVRRPIGGLDVRNEQLRHMVRCAALPQLTLQIMPENRETHAGLDGPMTLLETPDHLTVAYVEGQRGSYFVSDAEDVSVLNHRYGILRSQALTPEASVELIEGLLREGKR
ncbi:DUF5753 domain-containing protein [Streptomyces sp. NPDC021722]|uniref:DUF5753 domain-containing protein n=1 Tax=Streptomyces sp. NPDC021722 TaxID=3154904 RepID=UPI0033F3017A